MTEAEEQEQVIKWASLQAHILPELALLYHVPNEGKHNVAYRSKLARMGLKKGIPDLVLPVPSNGYHALYLEMKKSDGHISDIRPDQIEKLKLLTKYGNRAVVAFGYMQAINEICRYLRDGYNAPDQIEKGVVICKEKKTKSASDSKKSCSRKTCGSKRSPKKRDSQKAQ